MARIDKELAQTIFELFQEEELDIVEHNANERYWIALYNQKYYRIKRGECNCCWTVRETKPVLTGWQVV